MVQLDRTSSDRASLCWDSEKAVPSTSISSVSSNDTHTPKAVAFSSSFFLVYLFHDGPLSLSLFQVLFLILGLGLELQSSVELKEEIATLELEILHLERHLLSLYRTAFEGRLSTLPSTPTSVYKGDLLLHNHNSPAWTTPSNHTHLNPQKSTPKRVIQLNLSPSIFGNFRLINTSSSFFFFFLVAGGESFWASQPSWSPWWFLHC